MKNRRLVYGFFVFLTMSIREKLIRFTANFEQNNFSQTYPLDYCLPVYHAVSDEDIPHLKHILQYKNVAQFRKDLDTLGKNFQFVTWSEFKDYVNGNFKPKKKIALLTFDDGLREFKEVVAPILEEKGIFAYNFINPAFIDNQKMMFRNKASLLVETLLINPDKKNDVIKILELNNIQEVTSEILKIKFKNQEKLDEIAKAIELDFKDYLDKKSPYLNIDELHSLRKRGFEFGAHTMNHPLLSELDLDSQIFEAQQSLNYLWKNMLSDEAFAFPFTDDGITTEFFRKLYLSHKNLVCTFGSAGIKHDSETKNFQRIPMETGQDAEEILKQQIAYFNLKKFVNRNKIVRK